MGNSHDDMLQKSFMSPFKIENRLEIELYLQANL